MGFFDAFGDIGDMFSKLTNINKKTAKSAGTVALTGDPEVAMNSAFSTVGVEDKDVKAARLQAEAEKQAATKQAQEQFKQNTKAASMAYGMGGSNLQSFTNTRTGKKSILGSF